MLFEELDIEADDLQELSGAVTAGKWVKFYHPDIPDAPKELRETMRMLAASSGHCLECTALSGCYFIDEEGKRPDNPLHYVCHCGLRQASAPIAGALCPLECFTDYIYSDKFIDNGKRGLLEAAGLYKEHSELLKEEYERQAMEKYYSGDYTLSFRDDRGQRIKIPIDIPCADGTALSVISVFMVHPNGSIVCITPIGGLNG